MSAARNAAAETPPQGDAARSGAKGKKKCTRKSIIIVSNLVAAQELSLDGQLMIISTRDKQGNGIERKAPTEKGPKKGNKKALALVGDLPALQFTTYFDRHEKGKDLGILRFSATHYLAAQARLKLKHLESIAGGRCSCR